MPDEKPTNPGMEHPKFQEQKWKKGQSGNPGGRPKGRVSFEAIVAQVLDETLIQKGVPITKRELLARVFVDQMLKKNSQLIREFLSREWPVVQEHELSLYQSDDEGLLDRLASIRRARRGNGHDPEPLTRREDDPQ